MATSAAPQQEDASTPTYTHKVVFLGDLSVGKTSLINKFVYGTYSPAHHPTIGVDLVSKTLQLESYSIRF
jgi:GTPase SAR1 family protein